MATFAQSFHTITLLWKTWSVHGFVLVSLSLQLALFLLAPLRRQTTKIAVMVLVWSAYQLVGTAIDRALSLMSTSLSDDNSKAQSVDLYIFWSSFLLLHFGGPDTITALSMEDNNLWQRSYNHLVDVVISIGNVAFAIPDLLQFFRSPLFIPTLFMLLAGLLKSAEKCLSLMKASHRALRGSLLFGRKPNPGPDYSLIMEAYDSFKKLGVPAKLEMKTVPPEADPVNLTSRPLAGSVNRNLSDSEVVEHAYHFFQKFRGIYAGMVFCCHDRKASRDFFLSLSPEDAFRVVETEMKFAYQRFYTKIPVVLHRNGRYIRYTALLFETAALFVWLFDSKHQLLSNEILVTNTLLAGAMFIEIATLFGNITSDWNIALSRRSKPAALLLPVPLWLSNLLFCLRRLVGTLPVLGTTIRQWSGSIMQFNFINYSTDQRCSFCNKFYSMLGAKDTVDGSRYVSKTSLNKSLGDFIYGELTNKSSFAEAIDAGREVSSSRGGWILRHCATTGLDPRTFDPWITGVDFDKSVLDWHIATELCYSNEEEPDDQSEKRYRELSKVLSDYMLYVLVRQPKMMSIAAPMADVTFKDTCAEAKQFLNRVMEPKQLFQKVIHSCLPFAHCDKEKMHKQACKRIMDQNTCFPTELIKGNRSRSVLFEACRLAKELKGLKEREVNQWEIISKVWVELLCYAATKCPAQVRTMQLPAGGELITLVMLLMVHLGLSGQYREKRRTNMRRELVVDT